MKFSIKYIKSRDVYATEFTDETGKKQKKEMFMEDIIRNGGIAGKDTMRMMRSLQLEPNKFIHMIFE